MFLTYSQTSLTKKDVIIQLKTILVDKIKEYIICQEKHEDGGFHIHVYLYLKLYSKVVISNFDKHIDDILNVPDHNYIERQELYYYK